MPGYLPIEDHGLIGDLQTAALVGRDGTIDWFCTPQFDSPSVFAAILDAEKGGHFRLTVTEPNPVIKQLYLIDTAVLLTRYLTDAGVAEVLDFMPIDQPGVATDRHEIFRLARVVRGEITFSMECAPRFDYGRAEHELRLTDHHALFVSDEVELSLHSTSKLSHAGGKHRHNGVARCEFTLRQGENSGFILSTSPVGREAGTLAPERVTRMLNDTINFWRNWVDKGTYVGRWREMVNRSAVTIKLLTYAPTGAMVAAPTASLPEKVGGPRNWDYRFCWVRDSSFALAALIQLGYTDELTDYLRWLAERVASPSDHPSGPVKLMYRIDGTTDLDEEELDQLEGYEESAPVRIGNGAVDQLQLDIYGEALDAVHQMSMAGRLLGHDAWMDIVAVTNWLVDNWDRPDEGIWETRGGRKDFVYSRLMCWVAFDRAIRISRDRGLPAPIPEWSHARDAIYTQIMARGFNREIGAFVQYYESDVLDASLLKMPLVGFTAPRDPRWLSTMEAMREHIVSDNLVFRYNPAKSPDGLDGEEGTFSLCTFWYVAAVAMAGDVSRARMMFEQMLTYSNHLGLYSEQIGATGEQLGNFPQAFTHLALISAAVKLNQAIDREEKAGRDATPQLEWIQRRVPQKRGD